MYFMKTYINPESIPSGSITKDMLEDDVVSSLEILENEATTTTAGLMSAKDKTKLDGLAAVATSGSYNDLSDKPNIPSYGEATTGAPGLMSAKDKTKLDGLAAVATSGSYNDLSDKPDFTIPEASTKEPGLLSANDKIKLDNLKKVATSGSYNDLSNKPIIQDTTYAPATSSKAGLMSSDDKVKLDNLESSNFSGILNLKNRDDIREAQLSLKDGESKTYIISDEFGNFPSPNIETIYLDNMDDLMDLLYRGNDLALRHIINNGEAYYNYLGVWSSENISSYTKLPKFHLQTAKVGDLVTIIRHDFDSDEFYSNYIDFNSISNNNTDFQLFKTLSGFASSSDGEFIKHLIKTGNIYSAYSNPREDSSVITYPLAIDGKVQFYTAQITPNTQKMYSGEFWTGNMTGPGIYSYVNAGTPGITNWVIPEKEEFIGYVSPDGTQTLVSMKDPSNTFIRKNTKDENWKRTGVGRNFAYYESYDENNNPAGEKIQGTGEIFNDYINNCAHPDHGHAEGQNCYANGWNSHAEGFQTAAGEYGVTGNAHSEGNNTWAYGNNSHAEGVNTYAEGHNSHAEGDNTVASNWNSHAEGYRTHATGNGAHAEGNSDGVDDENYWNVASGFASHVEGCGTRATNKASHAEGIYTSAEGQGSHSEGWLTFSKGTASHAEGGMTQANGDASHAEGYYTIANNTGEHAEGLYNYHEIDDLIHSVGIGDHPNDEQVGAKGRLNAHVITLDGKHYVYGVGGYEGKGIENATDLANCINDYDEVYLKIGQNNEISSLTIPNNILSSKKPYVLLTYEHYSAGYYYKRDIKIQKLIEYNISNGSPSVGVFCITLNWIHYDTTFTLCINPNTSHSLSVNSVLSEDEKSKLDGFQSATNYATKEYVNEQIGNINAILEEIINM